MAFKPKIGNHIAHNKKEQRQRMWLLATCRQKREMRRPPYWEDRHTHRNTPKISHLRLDAEGSGPNGGSSAAGRSSAAYGAAETPRPRGTKGLNSAAGGKKKWPIENAAYEKRYKKRGFAILPATSLGSLVHRNIWIYPIEKLSKEKKLPVPGDSNSRWDIHTGQSDLENKG